MDRHLTISQSNDSLTCVIWSESTFVSKHNININDNQHEIINEIVSLVFHQDIQGISISVHSSLVYPGLVDELRSRLEGRVTVNEIPIPISTFIATQATPSTLILHLTEKIDYLILPVSESLIQRAIELGGAIHRLPFPSTGRLSSRVDSVAETEGLIAVFEDRLGPALRKKVRDLYCSGRWSAFNHLACLLTPGGTMGLDDKLYLFPQSNGSLVRFESGCQVAEYRDLRANPRCSLEILLFRYKDLMDGLDFDVVFGLGESGSGRGLGLDKVVVIDEHSDRNPIISIASSIFKLPIYCPSPKYYDYINHIGQLMDRIQQSSDIDININDILSSISIGRQDDPNPILPTPPISAPHSPRYLPSTTSTLSMSPLETSQTRQNPLDIQIEGGQSNIQSYGESPTPKARKVELPHTPPLSPKSSTMSIHNSPTSSTSVHSSPSRPIGRDEGVEGESEREGWTSLRAVYDSMNWEVGVYDAMLTEYRRLKSAWNIQ